MPNKINSNQHLKVEKIIFKNGEIREAVNCFITDYFLIAGPDDEPPTLYNLDTIDRLENVEPQQRTKREQRTFYNVW